MRYTPGPWRMGSPSQFGVHNPNIIQTADGEGIASVLGMPIHTKLEKIDERWAENIANARLIAAAPDLLEALENLLRLYKMGKPDHFGDKLQPVIDAKAAIAKATGTE